MRGDNSGLFPFDTTPPLPRREEGPPARIPSPVSLISELERTREALAVETAARKTAENALGRCHFFLNRSQEIGLIGSYVLEIPSDRPETQTWQSTPMMDKIFGIDAAYPRTGESWLGLIVEQEAVAEYFKHQVFLAQRLFEMEYQIRRPSDGETRWIFGRGELEFDDRGNCIRMIGTVRDITAHKAAEEEKERLRELLLQTQKLESIGILTGGMAHDFNNILTTILGTTEIATMGLTPQDPLTASFSVIREASLRAAGLIRQLLAFSRRQIIAPIAVDLNNIIKEMQYPIAKAMGGSVSLRIHLQPGLYRIRIDPSQIHQIIENLTENAGEAMPNGGALIIETANTVLDDAFRRSHPHCGAGEYVLLSLTDTGKGMPKEIVEHIFDPFFTTKAFYKGGGLGLAMVHGAVHQNGGAIDVCSEIGAGTTFRIYFPRIPE